MCALPLDHLVFAVPDVESACDDLEKRLGVRPTPGGRHEGLGTCNALLALSERSYVEVIGLDREQPDPGRPRPFGVDALREGRLVTWAARSPDLDASIALARTAGFDPGTPLAMRRRTPDGRQLEWRLTLRSAPGGDGLVPFLIDWGETVSPAATAAPGCALADLRGMHPDPDAVARDLAALGVELPVSSGEAPALIALLETPNGRVELR